MWQGRAVGRPISLTWTRVVGSIRRPAMSIAAGPLIRTIPRATLPGAVAMAQKVSSVWYDITCSSLGHSWGYPAVLAKLLFAIGFALFLGTHATIRCTRRCDCARRITGSVRLSLRQQLTLGDAP